MDTPLQNLNAADRELLDLAIERDLNLHSLISQTAPHPSRHTLSSLLVWFAQPHIKAAATFLVSSYSFVDDLAQNLIQKDLREGLKKVFAQTLTFNNLLTPTADNADRANRALRESRLVASALKRLNTNPKQSAPRSKPTSPPTTSPLPPANAHHRAPSPSSIAAPLSASLAAQHSDSPPSASHVSVDNDYTPELLASALNFNLSSRFFKARHVSAAHLLRAAAGSSPQKPPTSPSFLSRPINLFSLTP